MLSENVMARGTSKYLLFYSLSFKGVKISTRYGLKELKYQHFNDNY